MRGRAALVAALLAAPGVAAAGPVIDFDAGVLDLPDNLPYAYLVKSGYHVAARPSWLIDLDRHARGLSVGPTAALEYTDYNLRLDFTDVDDVTRLRVMGGLRVESRSGKVALGAHLAAGLDRPSYDFARDTETECGDVTTSGFGWEFLGGATYRVGRARLGGQAGVLQGFHKGDQARCADGTLLEGLSYKSTDLIVQLTVGFAL